MSLRDCCDTGSVKEWFRLNARSKGLPFPTKAMARLVEGNVANASIVGRAYPYLLMAVVARETVRTDLDSKVAVLDHAWPAEEALDMMRDDRMARDEIALWDRRVERARVLISDYINGKESETYRVAVCAQYLGAMDQYAKLGFMRKNFRHDDEVTHELMQLAAHTDGLVHEPVRSRMLINPVSAVEDDFGGTGTCIVLDDTIVDIKTGGSIGYSASDVRFLLAQAALQRFEGYVGTDPALLQPVDHICVYFARYNVAARWHVSEFFPGELLREYASLVADQAQTPRSGFAP